MCYTQIGPGQGRQPREVHLTKNKLNFTPQTQSHQLCFPAPIRFYHLCREPEAAFLHANIIRKFSIVFFHLIWYIVLREFLECGNSHYVWNDEINPYPNDIKIYLTDNFTKIEESCLQFLRIKNPSFLVIVYWRRYVLCLIMMMTDFM
jgi:hypothetical protein